MNYQFDIAVVGSGFAGSLMAMIARRLGHSVVLIDKGKHPRVVIGESSTPLSNLLIEELSVRYGLPALKPLTKWGTWQDEYPEIACGLKRGFTFYHHDLDDPEASAPPRSQQMLVAASPNDEIADTHWYRADLDQLLLLQAQALGVEYLDETSLTVAAQSPAEITLDGTRQGRQITISAAFLIDATGPRGFLHRALQLNEGDLPHLPRTEAIYNHFSGVERLERLPFGRSEEEPPYPIDDAAVHHVFDGGWVWVLQFNNGMTSAGVAATRKVAAELDFAKPEQAWQRLLQRIPALQEQFAAARQKRPFTHIPRLSFRSDTIVGNNWAMLPSAAGFVDPLLSTGFTLTLLGITRLAQILESDWNSDHFDERLRDYASQTEAELLATADLVSALYANMDNFPVFSALSLLYFAATSFSETARRLRKPYLASSFLLHNHAVFGPASSSLLSRARMAERNPEKLRQDILRAIEPFDVAGLVHNRGQSWHPVDPNDLLAAAGKLGATKAEVLELFHRCGIQLPSAALGTMV